MHVELIRVHTRDGCRLEGAWQAGVKTLAPPPLDGCLLVHGTGGNFYNSTLLEFFAAKLQGLGIGVVRVNTRGHDGISTTSTAKGGLRLGAAFEIVDDCRHDLAAWTEWLKERGGPRIGWLGHSLGAVKCLYAAAHEPVLAPQRLLAVSPPRLSYSWYCEQPIREQFLETYQRAEALAGAGQPQGLLEVAFPLPMAIAAAGYLEKYGPGERYNYLQFTPGVPCPALFLFGGDETAKHAAFQQAPAAIEALAAKHPRLAVAVVPEADHFYTDLRDQAWQLIEQWIARVEEPRTK